MEFCVMCDKKVDVLAPKIVRVFDFLDNSPKISRFNTHISLCLTNYSYDKYLDANVCLDCYDKLLDEAKKDARKLAYEKRELKIKQLKAELAELEV